MRQITTDSPLCYETQQEPTPLSQSRHVLPKMQRMQSVFCHFSGVYSRTNFLIFISQSAYGFTRLSRLRVQVLRTKSMIYGGTTTLRVQREHYALSGFRCTSTVYEVLYSYSCPDADLPYSYSKYFVQYRYLRHCTSTRARGEGIIQYYEQITNYNITSFLLPVMQFTRTLGDL